MKKKYPQAGGAPAKIRTLLLLMCLAAIQLNAQIELVKDLELTPDSDFSEFSLVYEVGDVVYFVAGNDLWKSDLEGNPTKIKDFVSVMELMHLGDELIFFADDGITGIEVWKSDGTEEGTILLRDVAPGPAGCAPEQFTYYDGKIFFVATTAEFGREIWRTDGTSSGTAIVKDIIKRGANSNPSFLTAFGDYVYFAANDAKHGYELWRTDGTEEGTVLVIDIYPGKKGSGPQHLTVSGDYIYFSARTEAEGTEVWRSDGTATGTSVVEVIPGPSGSVPRWFAGAGNGILYFAARDGVHGVEFWTTDGTAEGTKLVKDLRPGQYGGVGSVEALHGKNGLLYFIDLDNFYVSDGTDEGTILLREEVGDAYTTMKFFEYEGSLYLLTAGENVQLLRIDGTTLTDVKVLGPGARLTERFISGGSLMYFVAPDASGDNMIWKSDGTEEGTVPFINFYTYTQDSNPQNFVHFNDKLYFKTDPFYTDGGVWFTDGTDAGTEKIISGSIYNLVRGDNVLFFEKDRQLWKSGGTAAGTSLVSEIDPGGIVTIGNVAYFSANSNGLGTELWKSDGTAEGTVLVKDINPGASHSYPGSFINVNGTLFFTATGPEGQRVWKSDGTDTGTVLVKDIAGYSGTEPGSLIRYDNQLVYAARRAGGKLILYRTDGTTNGTGVLTSFGSQSVLSISTLGVSADRLYFAVRHSSDNLSLYSTDGTFVTLVKSFTSASAINALVEYQDKTYFLVRSASSSVSDLWVTDGTEAGTLLVAPVGSASGNGVVFNDVLYFQGSWLVRSDGTACGTFPIENTGSLNVRSASDLVVLNDKLLFAAHATEVGRELFRLDASSAPTSDCEEFAEALRVDENFLAKDEQASESTIAAYPNPFTTEFQLTVDKVHGDHFDVVIYSIDGKVKARYEGLNVADKHRLGQNLEQGLYFIKITSSGKSAMRRLVKR